MGSFPQGSRGGAAIMLVKLIIVAVLIMLLVPALFPRGCSGGSSAPTTPPVTACIDASALRVCGRGDQFRSGDTEGSWWNPWYWAKRGVCFASDYRLCDVSWEKDAVGLCTSQGRMITAFVYVPNSLGYDPPPGKSQEAFDHVDPRFNCHGHSFVDGAYWIDSPQVQTILDDDYTLITTPQAGDIVIYRTNGAVVHSARWVGYPAGVIDPREAIVSSKGGFSPTVLEVPRGPGPGSAWEEDPTADVTYYRRCLRSP